MVGFGKYEFYSICIRRKSRKTLISFKKTDSWQELKKTPKIFELKTEKLGNRRPNSRKVFWKLWKSKRAVIDVIRMKREILKLRELKKL